MGWYFNVHVSKRNDFYEMKTAEPIVEIGRSTRNDLVIAESHVSRDHLRFSTEEGHFYIEDLGSTNGTFQKDSMKWDRISGKKEFATPGVFGIGHRVVLVVNYEGEDISNNKSNNYTYISDLAQKENGEAILVLDFIDSSELVNLDDKMTGHIVNRLTSISKFALFSQMANFFKDTGDGFLATFENPLNALLAGSSILRYLEYRNQNTKNPPIHVRLGLEFGKTHIFQRKPPDKQGDDVNIAFGIKELNEDSFEGKKTVLPARDRILCSSCFVNELKNINNISEYFMFSSCGIASLKGIKKPMEIYHVREIIKYLPFVNEFSPKVDPFFRN